MKIGPLTRVTKDTLKPLASGGALLGGGGGGDPYVGRLMAEHAMGESSVDVIPLSALEDDALVLPVAMMGAPQVMQ